MTLPGDSSPTSAPDSEGGPTSYDGGAKKHLRRRLRAARAVRSTDRRRQVESALAVRVGLIPEVAAMVAESGGAVAAYASLGDEPGTGALRSLLAMSGVRVLLPVIRDDGRLDWGWDSDDLVPRAHRLAILEPTPDPALGTGAAGLAASGCAVILVPALAVDGHGWRLGQGGGFYDRLLADVPQYAAGGPLRVAVVHDDEVLDSLPHEPHDRPVDALLTPTTYRPCSG